MSAPARSLFRRGHPAPARYPGVRAALDGNSAVIACEREASDAAGAYPITPSTQMGEGWAEAAAAGHVNVSGRPLIFIEPEGEHAAAAVTAGLSMTGLRAANFSSGQGIAYMHESLYAAVGKRLTYVLNVGTRAMTKATLNVHAGHDDYHCADDTGFFQLFAKNAQHAADFNLVAHRIAELALNPGIVAQDGFLTTHLIESLRLPERALVAEFLGRPEDLIECPTPAQRMLFGERRRRVPELWDVDNPVMAGIVQNQDAYMQSVAAQRPFFFDHLPELADRAFDEYAALTGRRHARVMAHACDDADYLLLGQGSVVPSAEAVADWLREHRGLRVGVVDLAMFRPFPADLLAPLLAGRAGVTVLERLDQPLAADLPLMREIRATVSKCVENGREPDRPPHAGLPAWTRVADAPALYSAAFGLGSRDLQPSDLVGAVENMLPGAPRRRFFYLGIEFVRDEALTPKEAVHQDAMLDGYPHLRDLVVRGSENPDLMPAGSVTVRMHSVGGWGAIATGKNLAATLFDLLGQDVKANPKYGSEKKGQPTTFYLAAAPEPIRVNCEYHYVDAVLSPDPNVFSHTDALAGLRDGGIFVIQSDAPTPQAAWSRIPARWRESIAERGIRAFYVDAFRIAREEATDPDLQMRMQGIAFQGAFFAASPVLSDAGLDEEALLDALRGQLERKFGGKGARVVEDNLRVIRRGFDEVRPLDADAPAGTHAHAGGAEPPIPVMVRALPKGDAPLTDIHRFWEQTGSLYARGRASAGLADPFAAMSVMPASSALFRDMTGIRFQHPRWLPERCTGCGDCVTVCPDTAMPGLVNDVTQVLDTAIARVRRAGHAVHHLPRAAREVERRLRALIAQAGEGHRVRGLLDDAIEQTLAASDARDALAPELDHLREALGDFDFALTRPYFTLPEKQAPGSGGLFSITVNPYTCKGCGECIAVCGDGALELAPQTPASVDALRREWSFWLDLPSTPARYLRVQDLEQRIGALETLLLDKSAYLAFSSGDGACLGCGEKTSLRLFVATVEALMRPRVERHVKALDDLVARLERHVQGRIAEEIDVDAPQTLARAMSEAGDGDLTLSALSARLEALTGTHPIDREWLARVTGLVAALKDLRERYAHGATGRGRARMGVLNATGCSSVWGSTWPFNPYPFPWANHLFQDSASMAMGVFEGHMAKMARGFKAVRMAELEIAGEWDPREHDAFFERFSWHDFSDEELALCPPVVTVGGDGAMYDIGFQNLSRALISGKPIKVVVLDTQVYSNTGGQACTSGFTGQISDMAPFGDATRGKQEVRKELALIAMAHRTAYVMQGTMAHPAHLIEGFVEGLTSRRPALFNLYTPCQPEHGIGDDMAHAQARLAVESRAYPLLRFDPDRGDTFGECLDLSGNPARRDDWPSYELPYRENECDRSLSLPMTFADFAATEVRFRKHFRSAPPDTWHDDMVTVAELLALEPAARAGKRAFIWTVNDDGELGRLLVDDTLVAACEDRRRFWRLLRGLLPGDAPRADAPGADALRRQVAEELVAGLLRLAGGEQPPAAGAAAGAAAEPVATPAPAPAAAGGYVAPWIDSDECTACDECTRLNPDMFAYGDDGKAYIKDPDGGPYADLVKAAERCTARIIHPGLPRDAHAPGMDVWVRRAQPYN